MSDRNGLQLRVAGIPAPQGSKRHVGRGILIESSSKVKSWRQTVAWTAFEAMGECRERFPLEGPVSVEVEFMLPRGRSVKRALPAVKPDLDKLIRSTLDALTDARVWQDDSQVVSLAVRKRYGEPGATVTVTWMPEAPSPRRTPRRRAIAGSDILSVGEHG